MKKYLFILFLLALAACKPNQKIEKISDPLPEPYNPTVQKKQDSLVQIESLLQRGRKPKPIVYPPPPVNIKNPPTVYYIEFNGCTVSGTNWNYNGSFNCLPSGLTDSQVHTVMVTAASIFGLFKSNITITNDITLYNAAPQSHRLKCIVTAGTVDTSGNEVFSPVGGTAQRNVFGQEQPCFVFSKWLNYNLQHIGVDLPHEAGHIFSLFDEMTSTGQYCFCSVMGIEYYRTVYNWSIHNNMNDTLVIQSKTF